MNQIGDLYLIYRCGRCREDHDELILPLDAEGMAAGVALAVVWLYERALGASQCRLLVAATAGGRPYALAIERDGDQLAGTIECLDVTEAETLSPAEAYALARTGVKLPPARANDAGARQLVIGALERAAHDRATADRILGGIE